MESPTGAVTALGELLKNKWVAGALTLLCVIAAYIMLNADDFPKYVKNPCGIVLAVGVAAGLWSPGARKAAPMILMVMLASCATVTPFEQRLIDCATPAVNSEVQSLVPKLTEQFAGENPNWSADVGTLIVAGGAAALCALEVVISELEHSQGVDNVGGSGAGANSIASSVALARAYSVQASHHYRVKH